MRTMYPRLLSIPLAIFILLTGTPTHAQWSAEPGAIVRNAFGPQAGRNANACRGACGAGCERPLVRTHVPISRRRKARTGHSDLAPLINCLF